MQDLALALLRQLACFAGGLRAQGVRVGLGDEIDAASALTLIDLLDRAEVYRALRIAFKVQREAWELFDRLFKQYWDGNAEPRRDASRPVPPRDHRGPMQWQWDGQRVRLAASEPEETPSGDRPGYSPEPALRRKPFDRCSAGEIAALERLIERLAPRLAASRSRRLAPNRIRGQVDLRRSFRHALKSEGEFLKLARRARAIDEPRLVVFYDTSGSMDSHTRMILAFAFALRRSIRRIEIFAFNTTLVRVTRMISPAEVERTLERLAAGVPDWSGGTRIGACLEEFNARHRDAMIDRHTTVAIFSDGLDHGDGVVLGRAMRALRERAAKIIWLNPLMGDPRYRPETDAMLAAIPFVDHFAPAHNLESLEGLLRLAH